uniref:cyclic nucleotide-gated ion channel 1-like n=1 Tax=Fragaria vesca subsp. vesca TaxID=101020 RepID=UPI0005C9F15D|nr:PREDICTED: cyclic nucleotide-gated ion channel 1-like [Fragaria vesca subsp. vesca]
MSSIFSVKHEVDGLQGELNTIRETLFLEKLKHELDLSGLQIDEEVLKRICKHLDPVIYPKGNYIIREGEPADMMFFITQGIALSYTAEHSVPIMRLEKGECYGKELLSWAATASTSFSDLPISLHTVKAHKNVEIFALHAADLQWVLSHPPSPKNDIIPSKVRRRNNVSRWPYFNINLVE